MSAHLLGMASSEKEVVLQGLSTPMFRAALEAAYPQPESALPSSAHFLSRITRWHVILADPPVGLLLYQSYALEADNRCEEIT